MKRTKYSTLLYSTLFLPLNGVARKVETDAMHKVALNYFSKQSHLKKTDLNISETIPFEYNNEICFTIYNFTQKGYIVVSNHDEIEPILGYGLQNNFN